MIYPEVYKRLINEIRTTFPDKSKPILFSEAKNQLPYLDAVINESMRLLLSGGGFLLRIIASEQGTEIYNNYVPNKVFISLLYYNIVFNRLK